MGATQTVLCPFCGTANDRAADFCLNCAGYLRWSVGDPGAPATALADPFPPNPPAPNTGRSVSSSTGSGSAAAPEPPPPHGPPPLDGPPPRSSSFRRPEA